MQIIEEVYKTEYFSSPIYDRYFEDRSMVVFDIETMGLDAKKAPVILAAFLELSKEGNKDGNKDGNRDANKDGNAVFRQFFIEDYSEEEKLIEMIIDELEKFDVILTYNGKFFDLPYISSRNIFYGNGSYVPSGYSLDLYQVIHRASDIRKITGSLSQKSIEKYMGIDHLRDDEISGGESVTLFGEYLNSADISKKKELGRYILLHNHDDVMQLYRLLPIIRQTDFHKAMYKLGFPVDGIGLWPDLTVNSIKVGKDSFEVSGTVSEHSNQTKKVYYSFETDEQPFESSFDSDGSFVIKYGCETLKGSTFIDLSNKLSDEKIEFLSTFSVLVGKYIVLKEGREICFSAANLTAKLLLQQLMETIEY